MVNALQDFFVSFPTVITLNVGGKLFTTNLSTLTKDGDSMLSVMFSGRHEVALDNQGNYFIDRCGDDFQYILDYLRNQDDLPPTHRALCVYREAQFYQLVGLCVALEKYPTVFANQLRQKRHEALSIESWKQTIVYKAQQKCLKNLNLSSKVVLMSGDDYEVILNGSTCSRGEHDPIISTKQCDEGVKNTTETMDRLIDRIKATDCVNHKVERNDMPQFAAVLLETLTEDGYRVTLSQEIVKCKNIEMMYGYGREQCKFNVKYYTLHFNWL